MPVVMLAISNEQRFLTASLNQHTNTQITLTTYGIRLQWLT